MSAASADAAQAVPGQLALTRRAHRGDVLVVHGRGLQLPARMNFERWLTIGRQLSEIHTSSAWCLGDWLVYGEAVFDGRYRDAIERTALDYQTLRNYAWVAKRFSMSRRRDSLSFAHHSEVAAMEHAEQDYWLRKAEEQGWSVKRLRHTVRASLSERSAADDGGPCRQPGSPGEQQTELVSLEIQISWAQLSACETAAERAQLAMNDWARRALDQAARRGLRRGAAASIKSTTD